MSCQIHVPAKANTKMGKSFKRHYTTDISVYVYLRINVPEKIERINCITKIPVVIRAIIKKILLLIIVCV